LRFEDLVQHLSARGQNASSLVSLRSTKTLQPPAAYNILDEGDHYAIGIVKDRGNGFELVTHQLPNGQKSSSFRTLEEACEWIWKRVTDPRLMPVERRRRTQEEIDAQLKRAMAPYETPTE
jgi:hypothetical protein